MIAAILSSLCLAIMVILDQLMMKDTYDNSPAQAIIVSSVGGAMFGLASTFTWWTLDSNSFGQYGTHTIQWLYPYGLLVALAGVLSSQVLHQYFICFSKNADGNVIASWLAATPVFVYVTVLVLGALDLIATDNLYSYKTIIGVLVTCLGLYLLEKVSTAGNPKTTNYRPNLVMFLVLSVIYIILIDWTLQSGSQTLEVQPEIITLTLLPWFWVGFLYGARTALEKKHRDAFKINWPTVRRFLLPILILEIIGMYVFFFEFIGLGELDSVTVALITGLHAVGVWIASVGLGLYHKRLDQNKRSTFSVCGVTVEQSALRQFVSPATVRYKQAGCVLIVATGIMLFF